MNTIVMGDYGAKLGIPYNCFYLFRFYGEEGKLSDTSYAIAQC